MKPTVGRIVHYIPEWAGAGGASVNPLPAIITAVYDNDTVELGVFGRNYRPVTAVHAEPKGDVTQGDPGTWHWPPRQES